MFRVAHTSALVPATLAAGHTPDEQAGALVLGDGLHRRDGDVW